jgi:TetR/AcrR family transcriptional repressor of nem operon
MAHARGGTTKEHVLEQAAALIRERGFRSTSIGDILERAGVQKGSFYYYFPSKEDLGHAVLDRWTEELRGRLLEFLTDPEGPPPLERIAAALDGFVAEQEQNGCRGGCPFGNLAVELADVDERFRARLAEAFGNLAKAFADLIARAQKDGAVAPAADPATLGHFVVACIEGGILLAKVHKSCAPLSAALREAEAHLDFYRTHR